MSPCLSVNRAYYPSDTYLVFFPLAPGFPVGKGEVEAWAQVQRQTQRLHRVPALFLLDGERAPHVRG